jgi:ABC-2 type transport system ATP-binding protein
MATSSEFAIYVRGLRKSYDGFEAVKGIDFEVHPGEVFGLLGPNGAGKTSTVEILEGLRPRSAGEVSVLNFDPDRQKKQLKDRIGACLQATNLPDKITVREALDFFGSLYSRKADPEILLKRLQLWDKKDAGYATLSGGQKQRVALALALINDPQMLFLDEPTTGLDPQARRNLWDVIRAIHADAGKTVVLTTHYLEEAETLCDRVAIMDESRVIALDTPAGLIASLGAEVRISYTEGGEERVAYAHDAQAAVLETLEAARQRGAQIEGLSVRGPSLEDVFLKLTGREFRE